MLKTIRHHIGSFWRQLEQVGVQRRSVLVISTASALQTEIRIWSIRERWRTLHARSLAAGLDLLRSQNITVILYDQDLADAEWRTAIESLVHASNAPFLVLLASADERGAWKRVLESGGYDIVRKPVDRTNLARVVNSAFELATFIDGAHRPAATVV